MERTRPIQGRTDGLQEEGVVVVFLERRDERGSRPLEVLGVSLLREELTGLIELSRGGRAIAEPGLKESPKDGRLRPGAQRLEGPDRVREGLPHLLWTRHHPGMELARAEPAEEGLEGHLADGGTFGTTQGVGRRLAQGNEASVETGYQDREFVEKGRLRPCRKLPCERVLCGLLEPSFVLGIRERP